MKKKNIFHALFKKAEPNMRATSKPFQAIKPEPFQLIKLIQIYELFQSGTNPLCTMSIGVLICILNMWDALKTKFESFRAMGINECELANKFAMENMFACAMLENHGMAIIYL
ncbi:hypothetical protein ACJX0J_026879 [Zea mays]